MNTNCHFDTNAFVENFYANDDVSAMGTLNVNNLHRWDDRQKTGCMRGHKIKGAPASCAYCNSPDHTRNHCDAPEELRVSYYMDKILGEDFS